MITAKQMSTDFKQYFRYDRFKELVSKQTHYNYNYCNNNNFFMVLIRSCGNYN